MVRRVHREYPGHVGVVIQAYLYRSEKDIDRLISEKVRIRLCKGAYQESEDVAYPSKKDVDENYVRLTRKLLASGTFHGIATHDESIIQAIKKIVQEQGIDKRSFEFQMLYGVRRDLQNSLIKEGYGMRVYVPFGAEWYPYFMRRLAERPANVLFIARNLLRN
jgi:proline dehydrogenase